jgi:dsDNA-specific endonuclease/ATPase MutS2
MSRSAQDVLEFDKLRELLRQRTTCVLGRRAVDALEFSRNVGFLQQQFALIREAREWLRSGRDLGFGALSDPAFWLAKIEGPGAALEPAEFLEAASLLETAAWLRVQFREEAAQWRSDAACCPTERSVIMRRLYYGEFAPAWCKPATESSAR